MNLRDRFDLDAYDPGLGEADDRPEAITSTGGYAVFDSLPRFAYINAGSVAQAVSLLRTHGDQAALIWRPGSVAPAQGSGTRGRAPGVNQHQDSARRAGRYPGGRWRRPDRQSGHSARYRVQPNRARTLSDACKRRVYLRGVAISEPGDPGRRSLPAGSLLVLPGKR